MIITMLAILRMIQTIQMMMMLIIAILQMIHRMMMMMINIDDDDDVDYCHSCNPPSLDLLKGSSQRWQTIQSLPTSNTHLQCITLNRFTMNTSNTHLLH